MHHKILKYLFAVLLVVSVPAFFIGCAGEDGKDGAAGSSVLNTCTTDCHSGTAGSTYGLKVLEAKGQYEMSRHGTGETWAFEVSGSSSNPNSACQRCHTNNGFVTYNVTGTLPASADGDPSRIGCFTCHNPHTTGDFTIRVVDGTSVTLNANLSSTTYGTAVYNKAEGSICAQCHHARRYLSNYSSAIGTSSAYSYSHVGPHGSPQADFLMGIPGVIATWDTDPVTGAALSYSFTTAPHTASTTLGCTSCHMYEGNNKLVGMHSFTVLSEGSDESAANSGACTVTGCHASSGIKTNRVQLASANLWPSNATADGYLKDKVTYIFKGTATSDAVWPNAFNTLAKKIADPTSTCNGLMKDAVTSIGGTFDFDTSGYCGTGALGWKTPATGTTRSNGGGAFSTADNADLFKAVYNFEAIVASDKSKGAHNLLMTMQGLYDACRAFSKVKWGSLSNAATADFECGTAANFRDKDF